MKAVFWLVFLLCFPGLAQAQDAQRCVPHYNCELVKPVKHVHGAYGEHFFWFYRAASGMVYLDGVSCPANVCNPTDLAEAGQALSAGLKTPNEIWQTYVKFECTSAVAAESSSRGRMCKERLTFLNTSKTTWLSGVKLFDSPWKVKVNGTTPDRPTYLVVNGVRDTKAYQQRVPVGADCYIDLPTIESRSDLWARYEGGYADTVTLCEKVR